MAEKTSHHESSELFEALDSYPWDQDQEFQSGLAAILGPNPSSFSQTNDLTIRAKCYYYSRKNNIEVDFTSYKEHLLSNSTSQLQPQTNSSTSEATAPPTDTNPPYPTSFADIIALITSGAPIPGIKDIPDTVLTSQATEPKAAMRRKPWEKEDMVPKMGGTFGDRRDDYIPQETPDAESNFDAQF